MTPEEAQDTVDFHGHRPEGTGTTIGPYKLLQQIGEGGMGVVFMAEQNEPIRRLVALKVIVPGMDSRQVIARFEAERQALAMMDHPNIARVLDAGTTDSGRPYFVMELVKGVPITAYCDEKKLTLRERLELFMPVCHAVQHAHQKGIIHRDIKPSNVLVADYDDKAVPKVIDFGVAKATSQKLTDKTMFTAFGQVVGTMEYMSPEQTKFNQLDVDTRTDIYSLGVLLYELLTGTTPFDRKRLRSAAIDEVFRIIREEEPVRPSTSITKTSERPAVAASRRSDPVRLGRMLRGDLDWIVMKALEKDRRRRYETASSFGADVQRYLSEEPIEARPPSASYRIRKFVRRNRGLIFASSFAVLALLVGMLGSVWQAVRATRAEASAIAERDAKEEARREAVMAATAERSARQDEAKQRRQAEWISKVLISAFHSPDPLRDGRTITIAEMLDRAAKEVISGDVVEPEYRMGILESIGGSYLALGLPSQAIPLLQQVHDHRAQTLGSDRPLTIESSLLLATALLEAKRHEHALQVALDLVQRSRNILGERHRTTLEATHLLAKVYASLNDAQNGILLCEGLVLTSKETLGSHDRLTMSAMGTLGNLYSLAGRLDESLTALQEAVELMQDRTDDTNTLATIGALGQTLTWMGRAEHGHELMEKSFEMMGKKLGMSHRATVAAGRQLVERYVGLNQLEKAISVMRELVESLQGSLGPAHPDTQEAVRYLVFILNLTGQEQDAIDVFANEQKLLAESLGSDKVEALVSERDLADQYARAGKTDEASEIYVSLIGRMTAALGPIHPETLTTLEWAGRQEEAFKGWRDLFAQQKASLSPSDPALLSTTRALAERHEGRREFADAEAAYRAYIEAAIDPSEITLAKSRVGACLLSQGRYDEGVKLSLDLLQEKASKLHTYEALRL